MQKNQTAMGEASYIELLARETRIPHNEVARVYEREIALLKGNRTGQ